MWGETLFKNVELAFLVQVCDATNDEIRYSAGYHKFLPPSLTMEYPSQYPEPLVY